MKKLISFFAVMLFCQMIWAQNEIITTIAPKTRLFPSSGLSYVDDPAKYFSIQMINTTGTSMDVFFTIDLSCDFSASNENYYLRTKKEVQPATPLSVGTVPVQINRAVFDQIIGRLNSSAYETNYDVNKLALNSFVLPEGQYRFCITPYRWDGYNNPNPVKVGETVCYTFTICYTGSAPEFTTPVNGMSAGNFNNSNPANNVLYHGQTNLTQNPTSDNRQASQYTRLPLTRTVVFNWTGVISNCLTPTDFEYNLKIVEVALNQNVQTAIDQNGTLNTVTIKGKTNYIHDTVANRNFHFIPGHVYAAQVQAVPKQNLMTDIMLSNEGKSQIITFVWGEDVPITQPASSETAQNSSESNNKDEVEKTLRAPYFLNPGKDKTAITALTSQFASESANVPADNGNAYVTNVTGNDVPYYQLKVTDTLPVSWMPVRGDSVIRVRYTTELYEYSGGPVNESMSGQPLKTKTFEVTTPQSFSLQNLTPTTIATSDWKDTLEQGYKYLLHLKADVDYSYAKTTTFTFTNSIDEEMSTFDSLMHSVEFGNKEFTSDVVFAWGIDSGALDKIYPPQFSYPVDLTAKSWDDTLWVDFPEVVKHEDFSFKWKAASGVDYGDSVYYKLLIAKLPNGKTPQMVKDTFYFKDSITDLTYMDTVLYDSIKTNEQYMAVLWAYVKQIDDTSSHYNLLNKGKSLYATFKLKDPANFEADLNNKLKCSPDALGKLSKEVITPKVDDLIKDQVRLKMGDFPLVIQTGKYDDKKKTYSGDGYVIWKPFGIDVRLKVHFDSIQINKNNEIIKGSAASTATDSSTYLPALMNDIPLGDWTGDDINRAMGYLGEIDAVKGYYDSFKKYGEKYAKKYGGLLGPLMGGDLATEVLTFPLSITDEEITGSKNVIFAINNMFFSPETALMGLWAIFAAQDDDYYVPFLANNICMDQQGFLGKSDQHIDMFMGRSYEKELNDGYVLRFKCSSNFADPKDGTVISIDTGKLSYIRAEMQIDMSDNDFLGIDAKTGTAQKGKIVQADMTAKFSSWDDWVVKVNMDPFAIAGSDQFTFVPTGKGIYFDHSSKETPGVVTLPYEYLFGTPPPPEMKDEDKKKLGKANKEWQGFYWDEFSVLLSDEISNTFLSDDTIKKDSMIIYHYGINNTVTDSVHFSYPGRRINFGAKGVIIDKFGFSADIYAHDLLRAETTKGWGWAFSLDTINIRFTKDKYKEGLIKGGFGTPLFSGGFKYSCSIGSDSLMFGITAAKNPLDLDLWAAKVAFDSASSYFRIQKNYNEDGTRIDLNMNGKISISGSKIGLSDFNAVKFEHMGMRNYNLSGKPKEGTASIKGFEFDIGHWSFASPQKYIGGSHSEEQQTADGENPIGSVSIAGFTFSVTKFDFINESIGDDLKLGLTVKGKMKFGGDGGNESSGFGAGTGFSFWGIVQPKNKYHIKEVKGKLESIELEDIDFNVFKLSGKLDFTYSCPTCTDVTGFAGNLSITVMSVVDLTMRAGFGKEKSGNSEYSWWFFDGACKFPGGIPLGAVSINGFSGGFAWNMKPTKSLSDPSYSAKSLLTKAESNTDPEKLKSSGMDFKPAKDNWVANAGISMILTGAENTMNLDGLVSLRIGNGHFSGLFVEANAYVLTKVVPGSVPGDDKHNDKPLVKATTILGYERDKEIDYFRLSLAAISEMDLTKLLDGISSSAISEKVAGAIHGGTSLIPNANIESKVNKLLDGSIEKEMKELQESSNPGFGIKIMIPVDFELTHYKKAKDGHKAGSTAWYFSIGKPDYSERLLLEKKLDAVVFKSNSKFTFYLMTGNSFAFKFPELTPELQDFFFGSKKDKKIDATKSEINASRALSMTDKLAVQNGGGFCMGATFHAETGFSCFLYAEVTADLGFDVALLNVGGIGCPGHSQIGKHNFYAIGQAYAALQGDVGLKLNLGFWKGKFSLFKAGVGALLQAGGPNPSYCYGLLRFKVNLLDGLVKFSTSVDFSLGDVCVPGVGDPLANVKLFQNVTPGFSTENIATSSSNIQSPLQVGVIVSNMPWDRDVYLVDKDGKNGRTFRFVLVESNCHYYTKPNKSFVETQGTEKITFTSSRSDENAILFETDEGGFVENTINKLVLQARAFERRTPLYSTSKKPITFSNGQGKDVSYNVTGNNKGTVLSTSPTKGAYAWFDPWWEDDNGKITVKRYKVDTTLFFKTKALGYSLDDGVVFSWPYNGEKQFFCNEYVHSSGSSPTPYANMYLFKSRDNVFNSSKLSSAGKMMKIFLLRVGEEDNDVDECPYTYSTSGSLPLVKVTLPKKEYAYGVGPRKLRFYIVDKNKYQSAEAAAANAMSITQKNAELQSRISNSTYTKAENAHKSNQNSNTVNIQNQQLEEIYDSKHTDGKDSVLFYRIKMKSDYKICANNGELVYEWTWFVNGNDDSNGDYIRRHFSTSGNKTDNSLDRFGQEMQKASLNYYTDFVQLKPESNHNWVMRYYGWVFNYYDPDDSKRYHKGCVAPPLAFIVLNRDANTPLLQMHKKYFQYFLDLKKDFKNTPLKTTRYSNSSGKYKFDSKGTSTVSNSGLQTELNNILKAGLYKNTNTYFSCIDRRIKGGTDFTQCTKANYEPTTWDVPCILAVFHGGSRKPMEDKWFGGEYSGRWMIGRDEYSSWRIYDYASHGMAHDIRMIHDFMQSNQIHAQAYNNRGWSHKVDYFKKYYSSSGKNLKFVYGNAANTTFPYDMPEIYLVTHYMWALDGLKGDKSYTTANNTTLTLYDKNHEFIFTSELQRNHSYWAKYWWSAAAQCLDYGDNGFDRDFYWDNKDKYYNVKTNQANKGKQQYSTSYNSIWGDWYTTDWSNKFGSNITNYFHVYYLTSQASNFESNLMKIAVAVKKKSSGADNTLIFYPNAIIKTNNCYYNNPNKNNTTVPGVISTCRQLFPGKPNGDAYGLR